MQKRTISIYIIYFHSSKKVQCFSEHSQYVPFRSILLTIIQHPEVKIWLLFLFVAYSILPAAHLRSSVHAFKCISTSGGKVESPQMWAISYTRQQTEDEGRWWGGDEAFVKVKQWSVTKKAIFYIVKAWHQIMEGQGQGGTCSCGKCPRFCKQSKAFNVKIKREKSY